MADTVSLVQVIDDDLQLIYDVVAYLTPLINTDPKAEALLERIHAKQAQLVALRAQVTGG